MGRSPSQKTRMLDGLEREGLVARERRDERSQAARVLSSLAAAMEELR